MTRVKSTVYSMSFTSGVTMPVNLTSPTPSARPRPCHAAPAEVEAGELPERVEPEAARHHRVAEEVALEEPEVGLDVELGDDVALAGAAAVGGDVGDPVHHQHRRRRKLRIAGAEHLAAGAGHQPVVVDARRPAGHRGRWAPPRFSVGATSSIRRRATVQGPGGRPGRAAPCTPCTGSRNARDWKVLARSGYVADPGGERDRGRAGGQDDRSGARSRTRAAQWLAGGRPAADAPAAGARRAPDRRRPQPPRHRRGAARGGAPPRRAGLARHRLQHAARLLRGRPDAGGDRRRQRAPTSTPASTSTRTTTGRRTAG